MGLTQCGQFLLTYTYTIDVSGHSSMFKYLLHWWAFVPNRVSRKVAEVTLFGNYTIYKELNIVIAQWPLERNKLMIHGLDSRLVHKLFFFFIISLVILLTLKCVCMFVFFNSL